MHKISGRVPGRARGRRVFTAQQKDRGLESNQNPNKASLYFTIIFQK